MNLQLLEPAIAALLNENPDGELLTCLLGEP